MALSLRRAPWALLGPTALPHLVLRGGGHRQRSCHHIPYQARFWTPSERAARPPPHLPQRPASVTTNWPVGTSEPGFASVLAVPFPGFCRRRSF